MRPPAWHRNSGCRPTAPDHVLVWPEVKDELIAHLVQAVRDFYGDDPQQSPDYGRIINRKATERMARLLDSGTAVIGGNADLDDLYMVPATPGWASTWQVPRALGLPGLHQRPWRPVSQPEDRPGRPLPAIFRTPP
jgi:hypothetical protein